MAKLGAGKSSFGTGRIGQQVGAKPYQRKAPPVQQPQQVIPEGYLTQADINSKLIQAQQELKQVQIGREEAYKELKSHFPGTENIGQSQLENFDRVWSIKRETARTKIIALQNLSSTIKNRYISPESFNEYIAGRTAGVQRDFRRADVQAKERIEFKQAQETYQGLVATYGETLTPQEIIKLTPSELKVAGLSSEDVEKAKLSQLSGTDKEKIQAWMDKYQMSPTSEKMEEIVSKPIETTTFDFGAYAEEYGTPVEPEESWFEKTKSWTKEKTESLISREGVIGGVSTSFVPSKIGFGFPGTEQQIERLVTEPKEESKRIIKGTGVGISAGGSMFIGASIYNIPRAFELGKETTYNIERQKELNIEIKTYSEQQEKFQTKWDSYINPVTNSFEGTEFQSKEYQQDYNKLKTKEKDVEKLKQELITKKATTKELGIQFATSMGSAALFGGAFTATGYGLKKGGTWAVSKTPSWLGTTMTYAGTGIERGTQFYFTQKFIGEGIDIGGSVKRKEYELAKLRTAELGGGIAGFTLGSWGATKGVEKGIDYWKTKGMKEFSLAEYTTKPFWKKSEGKYVFMKRYKGVEWNKPSSWGQKLKGYKKGQFVKRQWRIISPEVEASMKGKSTVDYWKIDRKTGGVKWATEKTTPFPFDKPSKHSAWFKKYGAEEYGLPGVPKKLKGKPFGYSATGEAWKQTKFDVKPFKYKGGEVDFGAYQYYSGKGASGYFYRLDGRKYPISVSGKLFGDIGTPTTYATYFESVKKGKGAKEVKGKQEGRELKAYLFKEKMEPGKGYIPGQKTEVELTTTFTERSPFSKEYYFKLFGRSVPIVQQTLSTEGSTFGTKLPTIKIKDTGSGVSSLPEYTPLRVYLFGGVTPSYKTSIEYPTPIKEYKFSSEVSKISPSITSSIKSSRIVPPSYKLSSYKPGSYKPSSYKPSSYKPTSYKPSSYKPSSYKPSKISRVPYYPTSRITTPPKRTPGIFPSIPKLELDKKRKIPRPRKPTKLKRKASLLALGEGIKSTKLGKAEFSGLGIRPIIIKSEKKRRKKK